MRAMPFNVPNTLTWARILLIPFLVGIYYAPQGWLTPWQQNVTATVVFVLAALTDWLDGYLARTLGQTSAFGAFLDPVADKLMVAAALVILVELERAGAIAAFVIIGREIAISALREWMAKIGASKNVAVSLLGKVKTISQMVAIPLLLYHDHVAGIDTQAVGSALLFVSVVLTLWSMFYYMKAAWPSLASEGKR